MKLKNISFVFENCEEISIDGKNIGYFLAQDILTIVERIAINSISKMEFVKTFAIEIGKNANNDYSPFGTNTKKQKVFDRFLVYNDITQIAFTLVDDACSTPHEEFYHFFVKWDEDDEYINKFQTTYLSENKNLYIVISDKNKFESIFDKQDIDYPDYEVCVLT